MRWLHNLRREQAGNAAVEFALVAPFLCTLLLLVWDGWSLLSQTLDMRTAIQTGARYYQVGGTSDAAAQAAANAAWRNKPGGGSLSLTRACSCGGSSAICGASCAAGNQAAYVTVTATSTFTGVLQQRDLTETEIMRVR
jgi:Flp pilus assembly protein TadG